jgi:plastocyanin
MLAFGFRQARWLVAVAAIALFLGAAVGAHGSGGATASGTKTVNIAHFAFHPPTLTVAAGTKVAFANSSSVAHTATRAGSFDTGHIKPGKTAAVRFSHAGTFAYHCSIHPFMHGKIVVK